LSNLKKYIDKPYYSILEPYIADQTQDFVSRTFLVRYFEEFIKINDLCEFECKMDINEINLEEFYLEVKLYFSDLMMIGGPKNYVTFSGEIENISDFKLVDTQLIYLNKVYEGLNHYTPIDFKDIYSSKIEIIIQSIITDIDFISDLKNKINLSQILFGENVEKLTTEKISEIIQKFINFISLSSEKLRSLPNFIKNDHQIEELKISENLHEKIEFPISDFSNSDILASKILEFLKSICNKNTQILKQIYQYYTEFPISFIKTLEENYYKDTKNSLSHLIFKSIKLKENPYVELTKSVSIQHLEILENLRKSKILTHMEPYPVLFIIL